MNYEYHLSSGLFGLPAAAKSVDWIVMNDTLNQQSVRVTVFKAPVGQPKSQLAPGPIELTLAPSTSAHNANAVGAVFPAGMPIEVLVETNDRRVLPTVEVWQDAGGTVIAGTRIGPREFMEIPA
jgi:hypothetical protein